MSIREILTDNQHELYRRIDEVLHYIWDPIGVSGAPMARDEYYAYIPEIAHLLTIDVNKQDIIDTLISIETKDMGLTENRETAERTVDVLLAWKEAIYKKDISMN